MFFVVGIYISILKLSLVGFWYTSTLDLHMDLFKPFAADKWIIKDFYFIFWNETFHNPNFLNHFLSALILRKALCPSGTWKQHGQLLGSCTEPVLWYQTMLHSLTSRILWICMNDIRPLMLITWSACQIELFYKLMMVRCVSLRVFTSPSGWTELPAGPGQ